MRIVAGDTLKYEDRGHRTHRTRLTVVVRAPNISTFDISGRVFKNKPANANLDVPPHVYISETKLLIGTEEKKA